MTYEFCTLFDAAYLPRALTLYRSLEQHAGAFRLRAFCMDDASHRLMTSLALPQVEAIPLEELERRDPELLAVKPTRTAIEYYWTSTPAVALYCLETEPEVESITYLDADLMFFSSPQPLYDELGDESVLIVPHRYAPRWAADAETAGIYNVQFMTFRRDERGLEALRWWRERCLEWCYHRVEDGKMGDQKYLDDWPERFRGVHVLEHPGGGLAPWNVERYRLETGDPVTVDGTPLVFFHYHSLRLYRGLEPFASTRLVPPPYHVTSGLVWSSAYPLPRRERTLVWDPYLQRLAAALRELRRLEPGFDRGFVETRPGRVATETARRLFGRAKRLLGRFDPDRIPAIGLRRHRGSWRSVDVVRQMSELADEELRDPESVPPYRTFLDAIETLVSEYDLRAPARLLDLGCGVGHYSELLERRFPGRFAYVGWDYAPEMIAAAQARWPERTFAVNDVFSPDLDLSGFDVVAAGALVDVVVDYEQALDVLLGSDATYVLLHRQQIVEGASSVHVSPGYPGQKTHRVLLNRAELDRIAARHGRSITKVFPVEAQIFSFLLTRREQSA